MHACMHSFSHLQHCRLPLSPCQLSLSCSELSCIKSLAWGSFTPTVVILCSQILHPSQCQAALLPVPGLRGSRSMCVELGSSQQLLAVARATVRNGEDRGGTSHVLSTLESVCSRYFFFFFKKCLNVGAVSETQNSICAEF